MADFAHLRLNSASAIPLYKQLADEIGRLIDNYGLRRGEKLPPTRELAGQLGLNRATVSAAYSALEQRGLIRGHVGKGSFVSHGNANTNPMAVRLADETKSQTEINFSNSRPAAADFPVNQFRQLAKDVIDSPDAVEILQLGCSRGYTPLRRYLLADPVATPGDDLLVTNGCQQALDLIARTFGGPGIGIATEDPAYHGMLRAFTRAGADVFGVPVDQHGMDPAALATVLERHRPRLLALTPSFHNPTGLTLPLSRRERIVALAESFDCLLVEIDIYSPLRYEGDALPTLKELDKGARTLLLRSYSKVSFPGLRVGWVMGPKGLIARLAETKEISDLHSDQLSQAVLLRFAQSGALDDHLGRTRRVGSDRLRALMEACERWLPAGCKWTCPEGGMNMWLELPAPLQADVILQRVQSRGVSFLPGRHFAIRDSHARALRISFGGLQPHQITRGIQIVGEAAQEELAALQSAADHHMVPALV